MDEKETEGTSETTEEETDTASTSEETSETSEEETPVEEEESKEEDIDHKKELEGLEEKEPKSEFTELEKATHRGKQIVERIKTLGGNPEDLLPKKEVEEVQGDYVTHKDLALIEEKSKLRAMTSSDDEYNHAVWYVQNKGLSAKQAKLLANEGKLTKISEEIDRGKIKPGQGGGSGQKLSTTKVPQLSEADQLALKRSGYKEDKKTGIWEGAHNVHRYDAESKQWVTEKK